MYFVDRVYPFAFIRRERWGLRWKMCVIRKSLPSPDSIQLPVLGYSCAVNVFSYWFSSFTLSLLCLFLSLPSLWHTAFPITFPWILTELFLTCCSDWPELESELCYTAWHWSLMDKRKNPARTKLHFHTRSKLVVDFFFSFSNLCLFINSGQKLTHAQASPSACLTLSCTFSYPRGFWTTD